MATRFEGVSANVLDAVGGTPLIEIEGIYAKLEFLNPSGSIKARIAKYMAAMLQSLPQAEKIFNQVPPGLAHYKPLVTTMNANVDNYAAVDSMPAMGLFAWFFIVPGLLIVLFDLYLLVGDYRPRWVWPSIEREGATPAH